MTVLGFLDMGVPFVVGILRGLLEFKEPCAQQNKSEWQVLPWWETFMRRAEKQTLSMPKEKPTVERIMAWLEAQVAPSLAFVTQLGGGDVGYLYDLIHSGAGRLNSGHRQLLELVGMGLEHAG